VVVGRIGRPHGVRGEVTIEVRTDDPDLRFVTGAVLLTEPASRGPLTVTGARWHRDILLLTLEGLDSREVAETYRDTELLVPVADLPELEDPESYYDHQLVGLTARLPDGGVLGEIAVVRHEAQDLLVVRRGAAEEVAAPEALIPFVSAIVPTVDVAGGFLVVDPPEGLLDL
jgi:16S rRNA processing protein RimM